MKRNSAQPFLLAVAVLLAGTMPACRTGIFDNENSQWRVPESQLRQIDSVDPAARSTTPPVTLEEAAKKTLSEVAVPAVPADAVSLSLADVRSAVLANNLDLRTALSARQLVGPVMDAARESHAVERGERARTPSAPAALRVDERQLDILKRRLPRQKLEALEDEADLLVADLRELARAHPAHIAPVEEIRPAGRAIEAAEHVHQRALARARRTHDRDHLVAPDRKIKPAQRVDRLDADLVDLRERAHLDERCGA